MTRFNLALIYQKTRCILHRKYLLEGQNDPRYAYSRDTCIDAALTILRYHSHVFSASQPGGQLQTMRWYMSSLSSHDFLLAAMVVCLELNHRYRSHLRNAEPSSRSMIDALESSYKLWQGLDTFHPEDARLATRALEMMINRVKASGIADGGVSGLNNTTPASTTGKSCLVHIRAQTLTRLDSIDCR